MFLAQEQSVQDKSDFFRPGIYRVAMPAAFRPRFDACLEEVSQSIGISVPSLKKKISRYLRSYVNEGRAPPNMAPGEKHITYGDVYQCTAAGIQVGFCVLEDNDPPEIILVGVITD